MIETLYYKQLAKLEDDFCEKCSNNLKDELCQPWLKRIDDHTHPKEWVEKEGSIFCSLFCEPNKTIEV